MNKPLRYLIAPVTAVAVGAASIAGCGGDKGNKPYRFRGSVVCVDEASAVQSPVYPGAGPDQHKGLLVKVPPKLPKGVVALDFDYIGPQGPVYSAPEDETSLQVYEHQFAFGIQGGSAQFEVVPVELSGSTERPGLLHAGTGPSAVDFPSKTAVAEAPPWTSVNTQGLQPIFPADIPQC